MNRRASPISITDRLAALGDMIRLRILRLVERDELAVGEVAKVLQLPQSTVSRHLKVLSDGEWVLKRTEGTATYYRFVLDDLAKEDRSLWLAVRDALKSGPAAELEEDLRRLSSVLAERRDDALGFFGRLAGQWDDVRTELFGSRFTSLGLLQLICRDWVVADLGCGTGNASEMLAPLVKRVIAIDQSPAMLGAAEKRLNSAGLHNVEFVKGDMANLPLKPASVDAAVCMLVLHHLEVPTAALAELRRIIRPGGWVLVVDMVEHDRAVYRHTMGHRWLGFSESSMTELSKEVGFDNPRYAQLPSDTSAKGPGLFAWTAQVPSLPPPNTRAY